MDAVHGRAIILRMQSSGRRLRIALAQINPTVGDLGGNFELISHWIAHARDEGAALVVLPELALTGYPPEDLLLKRHFLDAAGRHLEQLAPRGRGDRRPGRGAGPGPAAPERALRARRRPDRRPLRQGRTAELRGLRRAPLLRAGARPGADRSRRDPRRPDRLRGHLGAGAARVDGGRGRGRAARQRLRLALSPGQGPRAGADGRRARPRGRRPDRPLQRRRRPGRARLRRPQLRRRRRRRRRLPARHSSSPSCCSAISSSPAAGRRRARPRAGAGGLRR